MGGYESFLATARQHRQHVPAIVIGYGSKGERFAAVRWSRQRTLQARVWNAKGESWTKWRKLQPAEFKRLATANDITKFAPDYGLPWERNW